jgi:serine protease AprX
VKQRHLLLPLLAGWLLSFQGNAADSDANDSAAPLLVMLQGENLEAIRRATQAAGATITHELPIIDAIGARMSQEQLQSLRDVSAIERVIDDLAWKPRPELTDDACNLAGSLQLAWNGSTARWLLLNKGKAPLTLDAVTVSWPSSMGRLHYVDIGGAAQTLPDGGAVETIEIPTANAEIPGRESVALAMSFTQTPASPTRAQNAMSISVTAGSDCAVELVPSYEDPGGDSYFPTTSGAALLHRHGVTGRGVTVAVLDSGLWEAPEELSTDTEGKHRVLARYDAMLGREVGEAVDESGHGTHMTSVIARSAPVTRPGAEHPSYRGIAPDSGIVVVKAFDRSGEAGFLDIIRGVQWVVENRERYAIRVLNLSFASRPRWPYWDDPVNQALMRAWRAGIVVVAAAGNEGPEPMSVGSPGNLPYLITVGAITDSWTEKDRRDDYLPDFSSRGPTPTGHIKPDIVAYGGHISGIMRPGATLGEEFPEYFLNTGEFVMTGTSQAAALVSGLSALLLQALPDASNDDVKCMLMSSAEPAISIDGKLAYSPFLQGSGLVNVSRAITLGERGCGNVDLSIDQDITRRDHFQGPAIVMEGDSDPTLPGQSELISEQAPEKGHSESRRWGAAEHVMRLEDPNAPSAIDWIGVLQQEEMKLNSLVDGDRP